MAILGRFTRWETTLSREDSYYDPLSRYQRFSDWCCEHEEVFAFTRTVCAVIGTIAVIIILFRGF